MDINDLFASGRLSTLLDFLGGFFLYYIPCLFGTLVNYNIRKGSKLAYDAKYILIYSITPSMLVLLTSELSNKLGLSETIFLGASFIGGLVADEMTVSVTKLKNILKIYAEVRTILKETERYHHDHKEYLDERIAGNISKNISDDDNDEPKDEKEDNG